jgi:hypothetical protein
MIATFPRSDSTLGRSFVHLFSETGAVKRALWMSAALTQRSFRAAMVKTIQTLSLDTTLAQVSVLGASVVWLPATILRFLPKPWCPTGTFSSPSLMQNATLPFFISLATASVQRAFPLTLSMA